MDRVKNNLNTLFSVFGLFLTLSKPRLGNFLTVPGQSQVYVLIMCQICIFFVRLKLKLNTVNFKLKFRGPDRALL